MGEASKSELVAIPFKVCISPRQQPAATPKICCLFFSLHVRETIHYLALVDLSCGPCVWMLHTVFSLAIEQLIQVHMVAILGSPLEFDPDPEITTVPDVDVRRNNPTYPYFFIYTYDRAQNAPSVPRSDYSSLNIFAFYAWLMQTIAGLVLQTVNYRHAEQTHERVTDAFAPLSYSYKFFVRIIVTEQPSMLFHKESSKYHTSRLGQSLTLMLALPPRLLIYTTGMSRL